MCNGPTTVAVSFSTCSTGVQPRVRTVRVHVRVHACQAVGSAREGRTRVRVERRDRAREGQSEQGKNGVIRK